MTSIDPALFVRVTLIGVSVGVGALYGLTAYFITDEYNHRIVFEDHATRRDKARVYVSVLRDEFNPHWREATKYTLAWAAAGGLLFALGTLVVAGIGAVFL